MKFTDIRLQHFRSYQDASFEIGPEVTIVVGPNAAGKTNLVESLMIAAGGTSYRDKNSVIARGQEWARIDAHTDTNATRTVKFRQDGETATKEFEIDYKKYLRLPFREKHPVVVFEPNDLLLLHGEPSRRRDFIDDLAEQVNPAFSGLRRQYKRVVAQRNSLLKQQAGDSAQLFAWDVRLADLATQIVTARTILMEQMNTQIEDIYSGVAGKKTKLISRYDSNIDTANYTANLLRRLETTRQTDIQRGFTTSGPHRDDLVFLLDGAPAATQASRGEIRTILLAIKILQLQILEQALGSRPLLLLDDVFSELDGARRKALTVFLKKYQTIITTTDADIAIKHFTKNCTVIPLQRGV